MNLDEIVSSYQYEYFSDCSCGKKYKVLTQKDNFPEYHTEIYLQCDCGKYVEFILPVN